MNSNSCHKVTVSLYFSVTPVLLSLTSNQPPNWRWTTHVTHRTRCHRKRWTCASGVQRRAWSWHHSDAQEGGQPVCSVLRRGWDWAGTRRGVCRLRSSEWTGEECAWHPWETVAHWLKHIPSTTPKPVSPDSWAHRLEREREEKTATQLGSKIRLSRCHRHYFTTVKHIDHYRTYGPFSSTSGN